MCSMQHLHEQVDHPRSLKTDDHNLGLSVTLQDVSHGQLMANTQGTAVLAIRCSSVRETNRKDTQVH